MLLYGLVMAIIKQWPTIYLQVGHLQPTGRSALTQEELTRAVLWTQQIGQSPGIAWQTSHGPDIQGGHQKSGASCKICGKIFYHKQNLKVHMRSHTGENPFKCETCGRGFTTKANMQRHHGRAHRSLADQTA